MTVAFAFLVKFTLYGKLDSSLKVVLVCRAEFDVIEPVVREADRNLPAAALAW
ncbi:MAG: hypothetical protein QM757_06885 [Paludibaculum sp.]